MAIGVEAIRRTLAGTQPRIVANPSLAKAAVLIPLIGADTELRLLLTRRTLAVRHHKGQVSFPGGARHGTEPIEVTALRETEEEIGVPAYEIEVLGRFHDYLSSSDYLVTSFVAVLHSSARIVPSQVEVAYVLSIPIRFFLENEPECRLMNAGGHERPVYFYYYQNDMVWGLTARIIKEFVDVLKTPAL